MKLLLKLAPYLIIIGLAIYIVITHERPVPSTDPQTTDILYTDNLAILETKMDSLECHYSMIVANLKNEERTKLALQRKYYETQIARIKSFSADSSLRFFTAYTSGKWGHDGSDSD